MTYNPVRRSNELRDNVLADAQTRAVYEATKLQIELALQQRLQFHALKKVMKV